MNNLEDTFDYCNNVDVYVKNNCKLESVVAVASEHNFKSIVVDSNRLVELVKELKNINSNISPIALIDGPEGNSSVDIRAYSIVSAKEKGAKEIEMYAPMHLIDTRNFRKIYEDLQNCMNISSKHEISFKYIINDMYKPLPDDIKTKLCRLFSTINLGYITFAFSKQQNNHSDNIIKMRFFKNKTESKIKTYIKDASKEDFAAFVKAGVDTIGLDWEIAPYLVHAYENMVIKR